MRRYIAFVLRRRMLVIAVVAALTAGAAGVVSLGTLGSSLVRLFFGENPEYTRYRELADRFAETDVMAVAYRDPALFTPDGFARLEKITEDLDGLSWVRRADSAHSAQRFRNEDDSLIIESYGEVSSSTATFAAIRRELMQDDMYGGFFVGKDGAHAGISVEIEPDSNRKAEVLPELLQSVRDILHRHGVAEDDVFLAGMMAESSETIRVAQNTLLKTFPITVLLLVVAVYLLFRRLWPVAVTAGVAIISVIWSVAFAVVLDREINVLLASVPAIAMVICFSDIIHLCSAYLHELGRGLDKEEAILSAASEVGVACLFTSITTFVGFISLMFVPTPALRQLGAVLGFGVAAALMLALTLVPIVLYHLPRPDPKESRRGATARFVDRVIDGSHHFSTSRPLVTTLAFTALLGTAVYGVSQINVETNFLNRLHPDNALRQASEHIKRNFTGTNVLDVYLSVDEGEDLIDPVIFSALAGMQDKLQEMPEVSHTLSMVSLMRRIGRVMGTPEVPDTRAGLSQYLLLFEVSGGENLQRLIDEERRTMRLSIRLHDSGLVSTARFGRELKDKLQEALGPRVTVHPTGLTFLLGEWIKNIVTGQRRGFLFAAFATTLIMMIGLGSFRVGLLSMIPNLLPVLVLGGYLGLAWDTVDSDVLIVAMIALGIGVDDTIHFLTRFRLESARAASADEALRRTFDFTGRAIVQTTVILCLGFIPFVTGDYLSTRIFGTLLPMTLVTALVADLLLVPALSRLGVLRFRT